MRSITVLGLDPGLGTTGFALASADPSTGKINDVLGLGTIETRRTHLRAVRKTSDDLRRAKQHYARLRQIIDGSAVDCIAAEIVTTTPFTYPTFSFGVMIGILASLDRPIIEVLPHEAKSAATGNNRATKREIIAWALELPSANPIDWPTSHRSNMLGLTYRGKFVAKRAEHPADALAVIQAALQTEQFLLAQTLVSKDPPSDEWDRDLAGGIG